jgi:C_GCAxxG_C_C family probable redox protein
VNNTKKKKILSEAYDLGFEYEKNMHGCAQSAILAVKNFFEIDDIIFKSANSLSGGISEGSKGSCGAFLAGSIIFSYFFGRDIKSTNISGSKFKDKKLTNKLRKKFHEQYQAETCYKIQEKIFGRSFNMLTEEGKKAMNNAGAHEDKCTSVVGNASKWIVEILLEENIPLKYNK